MLQEATRRGGIRKIVLPDYITSHGTRVLVSENSAPSDLLKRIKAGHREIGPNPLTFNDLVREVKYLCTDEISTLEQHSTHPRGGRVIRRAIDAMRAFLNSEVLEAKDLESLAISLDRNRMRFEALVPSRFTLSANVIGSL